MNKIQIHNLVWFFGFGGVGSIALTYFVPVKWRFFSVVSIMALAVLIGVAAIFSEGVRERFRLQLSPTRAPAGSDADVPSDESSVFYYVFGVLLFGTLALIFLYQTTPEFAQPWNWFAR